MNSITQKWNSTDYSQALSNAICQNAQERFLRKEGDKLKFNGFWRDGNKQNVCAWVEKATWHDAKTGQSGGCKEFAKVAFNMSLKEFMDRYGPVQVYQGTVADLPIEANDKTFEAADFSPDYVNSIWHMLSKKKSLKNNDATKWLSETRGIPYPFDIIGSGYVHLTSDDLTFFSKTHGDFVKGRIDRGQVMAVPLRSIMDDKVQNLFLRIYSPIDKAEKSRLLPNCGGWGNLKEGLRAFGFPHLIDDFPHLILCEGMADYFAAEFLLDASEKHLPVGAANADALIKWALCLADKKYKGIVHFVYQLDSSETGHVSTDEIGPKKALKAAQILLNAGIKARPFNWASYLSNTTINFTNINDLADSLQNELRKNECGHDHLKLIFQLCLDGKMP